MALYTQKFIAADYLAKVQTQTHFFFLRPLVWRAVSREKGKNEQRGSWESRRKGKQEGMRQTSNWGEWREDTVGERAESFDEAGCGSSSFPPIPFPFSSFSRLFAHAIRNSPRLNLAETRDFSTKTCTAFYCRIDHLNNSQHGNPSPTMRSVVLSALSLLVFFSHFSFVSFYIKSAASLTRSDLSRFILSWLRDLCVHKRK